MLLRKNLFTSLKTYVWMLAAIATPSATMLPTSGKAMVMTRPKQDDKTNRHLDNGRLQQKISRRRSAKVASEAQKENKEKLKIYGILALLFVGAFVARSYKNGNTDSSASSSSHGASGVTDGANPFNTFKPGKKEEQAWNDALENVKEIKKEEMKNYQLNPAFLKARMKKIDLSKYSIHIDANTDQHLKNLIKRIPLQAYLETQAYNKGMAALKKEHKIKAEHTVDATKYKKELDELAKQAKETAQNQIKDLKQFSVKHEDSELAYGGRFKEKDAQNLNMLIETMGKMEVGSGDINALTQEEKKLKQEKVALGDGDDTKAARDAIDVKLAKIRKQKNNIGNLCMLCLDLVEIVLVECYGGYQDFAATAPSLLDIESGNATTFTANVYNYFKDEFIPNTVEAAAQAYIYDKVAKEFKKSGYLPTLGPLYGFKIKDVTKASSLQKIKDAVAKAFGTYESSTHVKNVTKKLVASDVYFQGVDDITDPYKYAAKFIGDNENQARQEFKELLFGEYLTPEKFAETLEQRVMMDSDQKLTKVGYYGITSSKGVDADKIYSDTTYTALHKENLNGLLQTLQIIIPKK